MDQNNFYQNQQDYPQGQPGGYNQGYDPGFSQGYNQGYDPGYNQGYNQPYDGYSQNGYGTSSAQDYNKGSSNYGDGLKSCPGKEIAGLITGIGAAICGVVALICGIVIESEASRLVSSSLWDLALRAYTIEAELRSKVEAGVNGIVFGIASIPLGIVCLSLRGSVYRIAQKITGKIKIGFVLGLIGLIIGVVGLILSITGIARIYEYAQNLTRQVKSWTPW